MTDEDQKKELMDALVHMIGCDRDRQKTSDKLQRERDKSDDEIVILGFRLSFDIATVRYYKAKDEYGKLLDLYIL